MNSIAYREGCHALELILCSKKQPQCVHNVIEQHWENHCIASFSIVVRDSCLRILKLFQLLCEPREP